MIEHGEGDPQQGHWETLEGCERIHERAQERIDQAEASVWLLAAAPLAKEPPATVMRTCERFASAGRAGLDARAIVPSEGRREERSHELVEDGEPVIRVTDIAHPLIFLLLDDDEVLYWMTMGETYGHDEQDVAVHTDAPGLLRSSRMLFHQLWEQGRMLVTVEDGEQGGTDA